MSRIPGEVRTDCRHDYELEKKHEQTARHDYELEKKYEQTARHDYELEARNGIISQIPMAEVESLSSPGNLVGWPRCSVVWPLVLI